jgi:hypothetical protein
LFELLANVNGVVTMVYDSEVRMNPSVKGSDDRAPQMGEVHAQFPELVDAVYRKKDGALSKYTNELDGRVTLRRRIQVNPLKRYREQKAKKLGVTPSEVEVKPLPNGWEHYEKLPGIVWRIDDNDSLAFRGVPLKVLENMGMLVDGRPANAAELDVIGMCQKPPRPPKGEDEVNIRNYKLISIRVANADGEELEIE